MPSKRDTPLTIGVEDEQLFIRIGIRTLAYAFQDGEANAAFDDSANDFIREWKVINQERFAAGVADGLQEEGEDGSTPVTRILDEACTKSVENDMGVAEDGRIFKVKRR